MFTMKSMGEGITRETLFNPDYNLEHETDIYLNEFDAVNDTITKAENPLYSTLASLKGVNMEGFIADAAGVMKRLYIRFKEMLAKILNVARKVWLRTIIFFAKSDDKLNEYKKKADDAIVIESKSKEELKDLLGPFAFNYKLEFDINKSIDVKDIYTDKDYDHIRDIVKYVKKPSSSTVDYLTGKAFATYIAIDKDLIYMTGVSKEENKDKYAKVYKETISSKYYNDAKKMMYAEIDSGDVTDGVKGLFKNIEPFDDLKEKLSRASKEIEGYKNRVEHIIDDEGDDTKRIKARYDIYTAEVKFIYQTIKYNIRQTKLALKVGELLFD